MADARSSREGNVRLWAGLLLPPLAWVADLMGRYALVRLASARRIVWPMHVMTAGALVLLGAGAWLCWSERRRFARERTAAPLDGSAAPTVAVWGLALAPFFLLMILAEAVPSFGLGPAEVE
jgi:hypothetical protein